MITGLATPGSGFWTDALKTGQIRDTLALLEDALGQSDLRPAFETESARWRSER